MSSDSRAISEKLCCILFDPVGNVLNVGLNMIIEDEQMSYAVVLDEPSVVGLVCRILTIQTLRLGISIHLLDSGNTFLEQSFSPLIDKLRTSYRMCWLEKFAQ